MFLQLMRTSFVGLAECLPSAFYSLFGQLEAAFFCIVELTTFEAYGQKRSFAVCERSQHTGEQ